MGHLHVTSFYYCFQNQSGEKRRLCLNRGSQNFSTTQSCFLSSNWFFECEHSFIDKPMVTTEAAVPRARLLGLGLKLYPSNLKRMLNKDFTRFIQSLSRVRKNRPSERKPLLEGTRDSPKAFFLCSACTNTSCNALVCSPSSTLIRAVYQSGSLP